MAVTDLTGYTWVAYDDDLNFATPTDIRSKTFNLSFNCNNVVYNSFVASGNRPPFVLYYDDTYVYSNLGVPRWVNEVFRTINITGGTDATNATLIAWVEAHGTLTPPSGKTLTVTYNGIDIIDSAEVSGDVTVTYDNRTIVTVSDGTKTLKCNGKVMKSDVALGGKTLKCSGKRMVSDVVVKVEGEPEPSGTLTVNFIIVGGITGYVEVNGTRTDIYTSGVRTFENVSTFLWQSIIASDITNKTGSMTTMYEQGTTYAVNGDGSATLEFYG